MHPFLEFKEIVNCEELEYFYDKFKPSHLVSCCWFTCVLTVRVVFSFFFLLLIMADCIIHVLLHKSFTNLRGIVSDMLGKGFRVGCKGRFKLIDDVLKFFSYVKNAFEEVSEGEDLLVLSFLIVPDDGAPDILLVDHCLNGLTNSHLVIQYH